MTEDNLETSFHHMRSTITMLQELVMPADPPNYAVCYEYVSGKNETLRTIMDELLANKESLNTSKMEELFYNYVLQLNEQYLRQVQDEVIKLLNELHYALESMQGDTERFGKTLAAQSQALGGNPSLKALSAIISTLKHSTDQMHDSGSSMNAQLNDNLTEVQRLRSDLEQAKKEASLDYLTGLLNRNTFTKRLAEAVEEEKRKQHGLCLLMIDIDHFKQFNDNFGHLLGDKVIAFVGNTMKSTLKGTDLIARYGGEEFVVLLPDTHYIGATTVAEQVRKTIAEARLVRSGTKEELPHVHVSIGVAKYKYKEPVESFIERADKALYRSKELGRNRVTGENDL